MTNALARSIAYQARSVGPPASLVPLIVSEAELFSDAAIPVRLLLASHCRTISHLTRVQRRPREICATLSEGSTKPEAMPIVVGRRS